MRPGWKTTEFWTTLIAQIFAVLTTLGLVASEDAATLSEALGRLTAAVFVFVTNACVVIICIRGRVALKRQGVREEFPRLAP